MSYPTLLGPWFVVQRLAHRDTTVAERLRGYPDEVIVGVEYYAASDEEVGVWTPDPARALLFMSLHQAARMADAETAIVRVLTSKEHAKEFNRG